MRMMLQKEYLFAVILVAALISGKAVAETIPATSNDSHHGAPANDGHVGCYNCLTYSESSPCLQSNGVKSEGCTKQGGCVTYQSNKTSTGTFFRGIRGCLGDQFKKCFKEQVGVELVDHTCFKIHLKDPRIFQLVLGNMECYQSKMLPAMDTKDTEDMGVNAFICPCKGPHCNDIEHFTRGTAEAVDKTDGVGSGGDATLSHGNPGKLFGSVGISFLIDLIMMLITGQLLESTFEP